MTTLFVAGRRYAGSTSPMVDWEILGIYDDESRAVARCKIPNRDFVMAIEFNVDAPEERVQAPRAWYPLAL